MFLVQQPWKNTQQGRLGTVLYVCPSVSTVCQCLSCVLLSLLCASLPIVQTPELSRYLLGLAPVNSGLCRCCHQACPGTPDCHSAASPVCAACLCPPVPILPSPYSSPSFCLCPPIPILSSPSFHLHPSVSILQSPSSHPCPCASPCHLSQPASSAWADFSMQPITSMFGWAGHSVW